MDGIRGLMKVIYFGTGVPLRSPPGHRQADAPTKITEFNS